MRKKLSLLVVGMLGAGVLTLGGASPAYACHELVNDGDDPVYRFVCGTAHAAPQPGPTIDHYYNEIGETVLYVYCTLWDPTC